MDRRDNRRFARRLTVKFSRQGTAQAYQGFTTNISFGGLFLGTNVALERGERLRLEIGDREKGFAIEGQVVRLERVPLALRQLRQQGVGVRFLTPVELVADLFPNRAVTAAEAAAGSEPPSRAEPAAAQEVAIDPDGIVRVTIRNLEELRRVVEQDLAYGGLFVPTERPLPVDCECTLELHVPLREFRPVRSRARVVQSSFREADGPAGGPSGMGLVLEDAPAVMLALQSALARF
ncbi:MAG TPA: PilZ domain-containing protein [Thermoanaerobaculia bacterium]|nr:PilZ domain-containing protein [Thermoanaerobaculia bacterium]